MEASPFAKLPAELRNRIWEDALRIAPYRSLLWIDGQVKLYPPSKFERALALTVTCKAIRAETRLLYYKVNAFKISSHYEDALQIFDCFQRTIGAEAVSALGGVTFHLHPIWPERRPNGRIYTGQLDVLCELRRFALEYPHCKVLLMIVRTDEFGLAHLNLGDVGKTWDDAIQRLKRLPTDDDGVHSILVQWKVALVERVPLRGIS